MGLLNYILLLPLLFLGAFVFVGLYIGKAIKERVRRSRIRNEVEALYDRLEAEARYNRMFGGPNGS